jgi:hypothetical protein
MHACNTSNSGDVEIRWIKVQGQSGKKLVRSHLNKQDWCGGTCLWSQLRHDGRRRITVKRTALGKHARTYLENN